MFFRNSFVFDSQVKELQTIQHFSQDEIKNETCFFSADSFFALEYGGPITKAFVKAVGLHVNLEKIIFDSRVHMLMPGWWPCIPGWHHDDVPRTRFDGQPNYAQMDYQSKHFMALCNGDIAPTEFAVGKINLLEVHPGEGPVYRQWDRQIDLALARGEMRLEKAPTNTILSFDCFSFHRGTQAVGNGFRWFGRASYGTYRKPLNEIRRQNQVYLSYPQEGW